MIKYSRFTDSIGTENFADIFCQNTNKFQNSVCVRACVCVCVCWWKVLFLQKDSITVAWLSSKYTPDREGAVHVGYR